MTIQIKDDFIKMGQALKLAGLVDSGLDAKIVIQNGEVKLNGNVELQRGKKVFVGDVINYQGQNVTVDKK